jgi:hypothetical protein
MQKFVINNGNFTEKGFSAYTATGIRIFLHERQITALGYSKNDKPVQYPFYVLAEEKSYGARLDDNKQPIPNADGTFGITGRLTATAVFKTIEAMGQAFVDNATLEHRINKMVNDAVKSYDVNPESVASLASAF